MEFYNKIVCVTIEELTNTPEHDPVMTLSNYKQLVARKRLYISRHGKGLGCYALIDYKSLPERFRIRFEERIGDPEKMLKEAETPEVLKIDTEARKFFDKYICSNGDHLSIDKIEEYTLNASVLNEVIAHVNECYSLCRSLGDSGNGTWKSASNLIEELRKDPGHTLPKHINSIQSKIKKYKAEGYASLISGKIGNKNTAKITPEGAKQIIALKRSRVPVYNNKQIFDEYNRIAPTKEWKPLKSINSLLMFLNRPEIMPLWYDAVHGELAFKQRYIRKHKTKMPEMRDSLWYSDGTKLNLYYKSYENGRLVVRTTQVYEVMDAFSETFLGYHISDSENFDAQYNAFRMAIEFSQHKPYEIVNDNQGGHKKLSSTGFLDRISTRISRRTAPHTPQGKSIESVFGRFQAEVLHRDWRFTGGNITAKSDDSRPNLEFIEANKESLYTLEELKAAYVVAREEWNNSKHPHTKIPRIEMYNNSTNPETQKIDELDMIEMFWLLTEDASTFTSNGITIQVKGKKYTYEPLDSNGLPDLAFRRNHTYRSFHVMYDPMDMTMVRLYQKTASGLRFVATAYPYIEIHRDIQGQAEGDMSFIRQQDILNKKERVRHQVEAAALEMEHGVAPEQHGLNRPRIKGISNKDMERYMEEVTCSEETVSPGAFYKEVSNRTFNELAAYDKL